MDYELRIIRDCPNSASALELFRQVLVAEGLGRDVHVVEVTSEEEADLLNFHGSPSFIANGRELFPSAASPALTCRVYRRDAGLSGMPSAEDLQFAVHAASSCL